MTTINIETFVVVDENNAVDTAETLRKFAAVLEQHLAKNEADFEVIGNAVNAVFDQYKGTQLNMNAIVSFTLMKLKESGHLDNNVEKFKMFQDRIPDYVRANSGSKESGSIFNDQWKGKGNGIIRWADNPDWKSKGQITKEKKEKKK